MRLRSGAWTATALAVLLATSAYLASTVGVAALASRAPAETSTLGVPRLVDAAPDTVATMAERGPTGPVGLVFAATDVRDGLLGRLSDPWIAVSAVDGRYRAFGGPERSRAGAGSVSVSPSGDLLAWVSRDRVQLLDPSDGTLRGVRAESARVVGDFSPTGDRLLVHDGAALQVLDVESGAVTATVRGVDARAARQAVWTADGRTVTFVSHGALVLHDVGTGRRTTATVDLSPDADLAWSPSGQVLATLQDVAGARRLQLWDLTADDALSPAGRVPVEGVAMRRLLGFTDESSVGVTALLLDTGTVEQVLDVPVEGAAPTRLSQLPPAGRNWVGSQTLEVSSAALDGGTRPFDDPRWPWSHTAKLVSSVVLASFVLGLHLTRPPKRRPARPAASPPEGRPRRRTPAGRPLG